MEPIIVWYLRMSVIYFAAGAVIGVSMLLWPSESGYYVSAHAHLNLLGFMSMMIYGVGYHILPRFSGKNTYSPKIVRVQFWLANIGLIGMAIIWPAAARSIDSSLPQAILVASAISSLMAVLLFAFNVLKTIQPVQIMK